MDKEVGTLIESGNASLMLQNETEIDDKKVIAAIQEYYPQIARNDIATLDEWGDKYRRDRSGNASLMLQNETEIDDKKVIAAI